jgi:hypothetical protein
MPLGQNIRIKIHSLRLGYFHESPQKEQEFFSLGAGFKYTSV